LYLILLYLGDNDFISLCLTGVDRGNCDQIYWINDVIALLYHCNYTVVSYNWTVLIILISRVFFETCTTEVWMAEVSFLSLMFISKVIFIKNKNLKLQSLTELHILCSFYLNNLIWIVKLHEQGRSIIFPWLTSEVSFLIPSVF